MYARAKLEKAKLITFDGESPDLEVKFDFNPSELGITRGCGFGGGPSQQNVMSDYGALEFSGSKLDKLKATFVLDTTEKPLSDPANILALMSPVILSSPTIKPASKAPPLLKALVNSDSVKDQIDVLIQMTHLSKEAKERETGSVFPRLLQFSWGKELNFVGGFEGLDIKIKLFDSDGTPKRAEVDLEMVGIFGKVDKSDAKKIMFAKASSSQKKTMSF